MRTTHPARRRCAQNADHLAHNSPFSAYFAEVVCTLSTTPPRTATSPPPNGEFRYARVRHVGDTPPARSSCCKPPSGPDWKPTQGIQHPAGAQLRYPEAAAGHSRASKRRRSPTNTPGTAGVEGIARPAEPVRGAGGRRQGLAGLRDDAPSRRLAARTASGRAAAHRHTQPHNDTRPRPVSRPRPRRAQLALLRTTALRRPAPLGKAAPPAIRRSCPRGPRPRRGQPRGGRRGRGTGSRTRSQRPRCGRSGSTAGRHRARHTRRA